MVDKAEQAAPRIFERRFEDARGWFECYVDHRYWSVARFHGHGSMDGARAAVAALDDAVRVLGASGHPVYALADLSDLQGTPIRAQFTLGKWLFRHKRHFARIAIFGGRPWEMHLAKAIMTIARMDRVSFFDAEGPATAWLEASS